MNNPKQPGSDKSQTSAPQTRPTPEDPREHEPMRDPPIYPEHDNGEVHEADRIEDAGESPVSIVE